jgi:hypothetical protein
MKAQKCFFLADRLDDHVTAATAVAAVRSAPRDIFFPPKAYAAGAAVA